MKVLISGQGFAGSLLAWFLIKNGCEVTIVDSGDPFSSTRVSAGIMLPVTGRRLAKTQNADVIIPFARELYYDIEKVTNTHFFSSKNVLQLFTSTANRNEWYARSADPGMQAYIGEIVNSEQMHHSIKGDCGGILLNQSGSVNPLLFQDAIKKYVIEHGTFIHDVFNFEQLEVTNTHVLWKSNNYSCVVFCEGYRALTDGHFNYLPFKPAKGEILDFYSEELSDANIIVKGNYILPMGNNRFRIGSTYEWENLNCDISVEAAKELETNLTSLLNCDYKIIDQKAGIRPSVRDRRPLLGFHPKFKTVAIFNGLGTKGAMQGPFYAKQMAHLILSGENPDPDVSIKRFESLYQGH
ncbi:MAG: FAD-binding oxidoreductase [Bacteroidetes bacterium]|nr:FAD-binding oxidoreductase [Bacteroidota bacterium]